MRLDNLYFIVIFAGSQLWQAVQAIAVRLDYLYIIVIICRKSAVAGCTGHGCEVGLSILHCDICRESAVAGQAVQAKAMRLDYLYFIVIFAGSQLWQAVHCTGHGCEAG